MNKVKMILRKITGRIKKLYQRGKNFCHNNFGNTEKSLYWLTTLLLSSFIGLFYADFGLPVWLGFVIAALIGFLIINVVFIVTITIIKVLLSNGVGSLICFILMTVCFTVMILGGCSGNLPVILSVISAFIITWIFQMFARSLWALFKNKVHTRSIIFTVVMTGTFMVLLVAFLLIQGFQDDYIEDYLEMNTHSNSNNGNNTEFSQEIARGNYTVASLEYGTAKDSNLKSTVYNMTPFVGGYSGIQGYYRKKYQGYDIKSVPLAGKVWYPVECTNCPVLFIAHGNHNLTTKSYLGYDYLGEYLASNGYVVVSVDENFCNGSNFGGLTAENDGRAVLLLENIKQVQRYNKDSSSPFYQKMDYDKIAIAGHSRGGEMAATAVLFNNYNCYPSNGNIRFYYHFNIKSVIAIAPSVNQYKPAGHEVKLTNMNYLLLQGANDQDVSIFMGSKQYNNITFPGEGDYLKSSIYIAGANHGQFNTEWGRYDLYQPLNPFLNVKNLLQAEEQQNILKIFVKVFLDVTLEKNMVSKDLLYNYQKYSTYLPETLYIQNYQESGFDCISNFEEDSDLQTATRKDVTLRAYNTDNWFEEMTVYSNLLYKEERGNYALRLLWSNTFQPMYEMKLTNYNAKDKYFQFDIADMDDLSVKNKKYHKVDLTLKLFDENGEKATVQLSDYATVYPPLPVKLGKFQFIYDCKEYKHQYQTVRIPMDTIESEYKNFNASSIIKIEFILDGSEKGNISIDNIGFSK
jgi:dienelactone hydrolase